jgi:hypothetical protein
MRRSHLFSIVLMFSASLVHGAPNSPQRVRAFAQLPNWTGLWETPLSKEITTPSGGAGRSDPSKLTFALAGHPPYNPEWEQKYQAGLAEKLPDTFKGCGAGAEEYVKSFPNIMEAPMVFQVVVTPEETLFVMDHGEVRHIYTDRRAHPGEEDIWPTPLGDSVGHWVGQTLVIDTVARTPGPISMFSPAELGEQAHFIERVRQIDKNTLEDQMTIEDPQRLLHPWTVTLRFLRVPDLTRFIPYDCEDDRNPIENGKLTIAPPSAHAGH